MSEERIHIWEVEASDREPPHNYYSNLRLGVIARTMEDAIEAFRTKHPDARLHKVMRREAVGKNSVIIHSSIEKEVEA